MTLSAERRPAASKVDSMVENGISPANVVMLVQGDEVYGVGTVERLYAEHWRELSFVSLGRGPMHDRLRASVRVDLVEGL